MKKICLLFILFCYYPLYSCPGFGSFYGILNRIWPYSLNGQQQIEQAEPEQVNNASNISENGSEMSYEERERLIVDLEQETKNEIKKIARSYKNNEITEQEFKRKITVMYFETMFIFSPEKMAQLFPGMTLRIVTPRNNGNT